MKIGTNYYVKTPLCANPCEHCGASEEFHLGKSSAGWTFHFRAYTSPQESLDFPVTDFASWKRLASLGVIRDEYGVPCSLDDLLELIESKRPGRNHALDYPSDHTFLKDGHAFTDVEFF